MYKKIAAALAIGFMAASSTFAGTDIDYSNGVVYVETDERDDIVFIDVVDGEIEINVFQMSEDFAETSDDYVDLFHFYQHPSVDFSDGLYEGLEDIAERDRRWSRDRAEVDRIVVRTFDGDDAVRCYATDMDITVYCGSGNDYVFCRNSAKAKVYGEDGDDHLRNLVYHPFYKQQACMFGGAGDDLIRSSGNATTWVSGDDGFDSIECRYCDKKCYIWGGADSDEISGGYEDDLIFGGGGTDDINGYEGDDTIYGNEELDWIQGGTGNDFLDGGFDGESDVLHAGQGFDEVVGFYFRYPSSRFANKDLMIRLEEETVVDAEIISGGEK